MRLTNIVLYACIMLCTMLSASGSLKLGGVLPLVYAQEDECSGCCADGETPYTRYYYCSGSVCTSACGCNESSTCSSNSDCEELCDDGTEPHYYYQCSGEYCSEYYGCGVTTCSYDSDCSEVCSDGLPPRDYYECAGNACVSNYGCGTSSCDSDSDCCPVSEPQEVLRTVAGPYCNGHDECYTTTISYERVDCNGNVVESWDESYEDCYYSDSCVYE